MYVILRWNQIMPFAGLVCLLVAAGPRAAWSHAADEAAPPPGAVVIAPRVEARFGQTEVVAVFSKQIFAVFLSRYADDSPITGAKIEASTDLQTAELKETDPGVYTTTDLLMSSGRNDLSLKVTAGGVTSTQSVALMMPVEAPAAPSQTQPAITTATPLTIAGALAAVYALLSAAFLVARRRSPRRASIARPVQAQRS